jgi:hypothetical protein
MASLAVLLIIASAFNALAQDADIRSTITKQFEAFKVDDFATAFTFASPTLQTLFQSPENFGRMVVKGYPMVWRPAAVEYLDLREKSGVFFQTVQITDQEDSVHYLEYRMQKISDGWRINGVRILEAPSPAA